MHPLRPLNTLLNTLLHLLLHTFSRLPKPSHASTFSSLIFLQVFSWSVMENHYGGTGGGSMKSRLILKSEVAKLEPIERLANDFFNYSGDKRSSVKPWWL